MPLVKLFFTALFVAFFCLSYSLYCEDLNEVVVVGSRDSTDENTAPKSIVTAKEIEQKQSVTVGDAIKEISGVYVNGDGRTGEAQFVFVRGFRSADLLVLVDGVEIKNPLSPNGAADLSFAPENIAKIELLKGPQPALFGSGALSGVLNVKTKRGYGPPKFTSSFFTGVLDMSDSRYIPDIFSLNADLSGSKKSFFYSGGTSFFYTEGISTADSYRGVKENLYDKEPENDRVIKGEIYFRGGIAIDSNKTWEIILRGKLGKFDIDDGPGLGMDDENRFLKNRSLIVKSGYDADLFNKIWKLEISALAFLTSLSDDDPKDEGQVTGDLSSLYQGISASLKWKNSINLFDWYKIIAGIDLKSEWGEANYEDYSSGRYFSMDFKPNPDVGLEIYLFNIFKPLKKFEINGGIRVQNNFYQLALLDKTTDKLLPESTKKIIEPLFSIGISYEAPSETVLKSKFARGTKSPTLFQRFSRYADLYRELLPEIVYGYDGTIQQYLAKRKILLEAGYFYELKLNSIDLDKSGKFSNRYRMENHGLEFAFQTKPFWGIGLKSSYTWIFKMDEFKVVKYRGKKYKEKSACLRRPKHSFNLLLNYNYKKIVNLSLTLNYVGKRRDEVYNYPKTPYEITADDFVILNFAVSYKINNYLILLAKIENMLDDDDYAYSVEYGTAGITPWIGFKVNIGKEKNDL